MPTEPVPVPQGTVPSAQTRCSLRASPGRLVRWEHWEQGLFAPEKPDPLLFVLLLGQVSPGSPATPKMGFLGALALRGRPDPPDTPAPRARPAPPASATPPSAPTSPALPPALGM